MPTLLIHRHAVCPLQFYMLLPIGVETATQRMTAAVVYCLIVINIIIFLFELGAGDQFIAGYAVVPYEITHGVWGFAK